MEVQISKTADVAVVVVAQPIGLSLLYFPILAAAIGSGIGGAAVFKRFNTTTAPFEDIFNLTMASSTLQPHC